MPDMTDDERSRVYTKVTKTVSAALDETASLLIAGAATIVIRGTFVATIKLYISTDYLDAATAATATWDETGDSWTAPVVTTIDENTRNKWYKLVCTAYTSGTPIMEIST